MRNILFAVLQVVAAFIIVDIFIVMWMFMAIALGNQESMYHVPYWDKQLQFVVDLIN
jgi:membrane protein implicated in regulation of membrane protease activity